LIERDTIVIDINDEKVKIAENEDE